MNCKYEYVKIITFFFVYYLSILISGANRRLRKGKIMEKGYLSIVLHGHLPFVRHPEHENFLEEEWLYEAITETYIPLLTIFEQLLQDNVEFRIRTGDEHHTAKLLTILKAELQDGPA